MIQRAPVNEGSTAHRSAAAMRRSLFQAGVCTTRASAACTHRANVVQCTRIARSRHHQIAQRRFATTTTIPPSSVEAPDDLTLALLDIQEWDSSDQAWLEARLSGQPTAQPQADEANPTGESIEERIKAAFEVPDDPDAPDAFPPPPSLDDRVTALPQLYTSLPLTDLSAANVNQYCKLTEDQVKNVPKSLAASVANEVEMTQGYLLLRESYLPIIEMLALMGSDSTAHYRLRKPIGVHGDAGTGKSTLVYYLYQWAAARSDWLPLYIKAEDFSKEKLGWLKANSDREGIMDQPLFTSEWLKELVALQGEKLAKIPLTTTGDYDWSAVDSGSGSANGDRTLYDLANLAASDSSQSSRILYHFVDELRRTTSIQPMVLIDDVNCWDSASDFIDPSNSYKPLPSRRLALVDAFSLFQSVAPANGVSVFATTTHETNKNLKNHFNLKKVRPILLKQYNDWELKHVLVHYHVSGVCIESVNENLLGKIKGLSGAIPREVQLVAKAL